MIKNLTSCSLYRCNFKYSTLVRVCLWNKSELRINIYLRKIIKKHEVRYYYSYKIKR